jgi:hypothetical protein
VHPSQDCPVGMVDGGGASISGLPGQEPPPPPSCAEEDLSAGEIAARTGDSSTQVQGV